MPARAAAALPGESEEDKGAMKKKAKAKVRRAAAKLRPEGSQKPLPRGRPVDEVVMVGGSSQMVAVRKLVTNLFGVAPRRTVDPMQAVAVGAAIQAGILSGEVSGVRVVQSWQATLGRLLEQMRDPELAAQAAAEAADVAEAALASDAGPADDDSDDWSWMDDVPMDDMPPPVVGPA